jgi:hypothetical protein
VYLAATVGPLALAWAWCSSLLSNYYLVDSIIVGRGLPHPWTLVSAHLNAIVICCTSMTWCMHFEYDFCCSRVHSS